VRRSERGKPNQRFSWRAGRFGSVRACFQLRPGNSKHPGEVFFCSTSNCNHLIAKCLSSTEPHLSAALPGGQCR
jgi:hypothetical protein